MGQIDLRQEYQRRLCEQIFTIYNGIPNIVDLNNQSSIKIGTNIIRRLGYPLRESSSNNRNDLQKLFNQLTRDFLGNFCQQLYADKWVISPVLH